MRPSATALTGYGEKLHLLRCAEGQGSFAGDSGVYTNSLLSPPKSWGAKGVETRVRQHWNRLNWPRESLR